MKLIKGMSILTLILSFFTLIDVVFAANTDQNDGVVAKQIFDNVKANDNWKWAFLTAKNAQVVCMNVSPSTNPTNEIGMETHPFDQIIFIAEGRGKAILNGKATLITASDMIFIPAGVAHNVVNLDAKKPLKLLSVYSSQDIPVGAIYPKKSDEPHV